MENELDFYQDKSKDVIFENVPSDLNPRKIIGHVYKTDLPIKGGWGYSKDDAVIIDKNDDSIKNSTANFDGVSLEYWFAQRRAWLEFITGRVENDRFSGVELKLITQSLHQTDNKTYDCLIFSITALRDDDFDELKEDWNYITNGSNNLTIEEQENKKQENEQRREDKLIRIKAEYWFEISSFYNKQ